MLDAALALLLDYRTFGLGLVVVAVYMLLQSRISITYPREEETKK